MNESYIDLIIKRKVSISELQECLAFVLNIPKNTVLITTNIEQTLNLNMDNFKFWGELFEVKGDFSFYLTSARVDEDIIFNEEILAQQISDKLSTDCLCEQEIELDNYILDCWLLFSPNTSPKQVYLEEDGEKEEDSCPIYTIKRNN